MSERTPLALLRFTKLDQKDLIDRMIDTLSKKPKSESHDTPEEDNGV